LAEIVLETSKRVGLKKVALSGGVFQNDPLVGRIKEKLQREGFEVLTHSQVPPNDGGLSLGQAVFGGLLS